VLLMLLSLLLLLLRVTWTAPLLFQSRIGSPFVTSTAFA
jgi:hypothetical protein